MLTVDQVNISQETCFQINGSIEILVSDGSAPYQYTWSSGISNTNIYNNIAAGDYSVTVTDQDGCSITREMTIQNLNIELSVLSTTPSICGDNNGTVSIGVVSDFPDYTFDWGPIIHFNNNSATQLSAGDYSVNVNTDNCIATIDFTIDEIPGPDACFEIEYPYGNGINIPITFKNCTENSENWIWSFGDFGTSNSENSTHKYTSEGEFIVTLVASNEFGCKDSVSKIITIIGDTDVFIPNSFSPNQDGNNDIFIPVMREVNSKGYSLKIFNRWGELVFVSYNIEQGWDGTIGGIPVEMGSTYSYIIFYENLNGRKLMKKGSVTIIK
jgi:gliding motility-associated-like protein